VERKGTGTEVAVVIEIDVGRPVRQLVLDAGDGEERARRTRRQALTPGSRARRGHGRLRPGTRVFLASVMDCISPRGCAMMAE
jgi:hypothetical protein